MANRFNDIEERLEEIKTYAESMKDASRWHESKKTISHIQSSKNEETKREYIYEFYCYLRILRDLNKNYNLKFIEGGKYRYLFPRAPGLKNNFPYFSICNKGTGEEEFQLCAGIKIKGVAGESSAPDISFLEPKTNDEPIHDDVFMLHDAKFKHNEKAKVTGEEFAKVTYMINNLDCNFPTDDEVEFDEFNDSLNLNGNCILTNGKAYKKNKLHHKFFSIKEVESFDVNKKPNVIG